jgi:hypothetical protein
MLGNSKWLSALALIVLATGPATAHSQAVDAAARRALQEQVLKSRASVMNPAKIAAAREFTLPEAQPLPGEQGELTVSPADSTVPDLESPGFTAPPVEDAAVSGAAISDATISDTNVLPVKTLVRGQLYHVNLPPQEEAQAQALVIEQVTTTSAFTADEVKSFNGVVRQVTEDDVEVSLKPYVLVGQRLRFMPELHRFVGSVAVGVVDLFNSGGNEVLSAPLKFQAIESQELKTLDHLSPPFEYFAVSTAASGEPVTLRIASNFSHEGVAVTVPVEPTLIVEIDNPELRGLGLQRTNVKIRAVGGIVAPQGEVSLEAPGAFLDEAPAVFDEHGIAHSGLRSDSAGVVTLTASATGYVPGEKSVTVKWPWLTLIITCIGGFVGGFIRLGPKIRRGINVLRFVIGLVIAVLTGLLVFALYVVGVKVLPVSFSVEVGDLFAFAAAALGGWLGSGVLPGLKPAGP